MKTPKKALYFFIFFIIIFSIYSCLRYKEELNYEKKGELLISKIENYKKNHLRLPNQLSEIGLREQMNKGPYYEKINDYDYIVYFSIGFDNTYTYYSKTHKWIYTP